MKKIKAINLYLYNARNNLGKSRKEAAKHLKITSLHLKLIEEGYLSVSKKKQPMFIKYYRLERDFFNKYSRNIHVLNPAKNDKHKNIKQASLYAKKRFKIIPGILGCITLASLIYGCYQLNEQYINPRAAWTENFTKFNETAKQLESEVSPDVFLNDNIHTISGSEITETVETEGYKKTYKASLGVYEKDCHSSDMTIVLNWSNYRNGNDGEYSKWQASFQFNISFYNKKKIIYTTYSSAKDDQGDTFFVTSALGFIEDNGFVNLRPFTYVLNGISYKAEVDDEFYNSFTGLLNGYVIDGYKAANKLLEEKGLSDTYSNVLDLIEDTQKISRHYIFSFRMGNLLVILGSILSVCCLAVLGLSCYCSHYLKKKSEPKTAKQITTKIVYSTAPREIPNDIALSPLLPELSLRIIGLSTILLSSIALYLSVNYFLRNFETSSMINVFKNITSNGLIFGTALLLFLKIDLYSNKSEKDLITNILLLFIGGLFYYFMEVILYSDVTRTNGLLSLLAGVFVNFLPGNIIWNLMLYSLIFLFLFITPERYKRDPHKILIFRLCSIIPTLFLAFAFIYKTFIESQISSAYWFSFMFYTKGILITLFAVLIIYSVFFYRLYCKYKYGEDGAKVFFNSRRYSLTKNLIASIIITLLVLVDVFCRYKLPDNNLGLGNNWPMIFLVPVIMLYRPHIGKRNSIWDKSFITMYGSFMAIGYVLVFISIIRRLDLSDFIAILF